MMIARAVQTTLHIPLHFAARPLFFVFLEIYSSTLRKRHTDFRRWRARKTAAGKLTDGDGDGDGVATTEYDGVWRT